MSVHHATLLMIRRRRALVATRPPERRKLGRLPKPKPPTQVEALYARQILAIRKQVLTQLKATLFKNLADLVAQAERDRGDSAEHADAAGGQGKDIIERIRREMAQRIPDSEARRVATQVATQTRDHGKKVLDDQMRKGLGVDVFRIEPDLAGHLDTFVTQNVGLIQSVPRDMLYRVEQSLLVGLRQGERASAIAANLQEQVEVSESRARFIARDQVAKLNGELNKVRQVKLGLSGYIWRTVGDEAVRPNHAEKEGDHYDWDDPPADTGHPGEDYQCRCSAEPDLQQLLDDADAADGVEQEEEDDG